ncbi:hypothetical protein PybrP1_000842 [[Pythium] brassicae (nom. inval.)]|nr:hypothetical protein PybrP1_000842 [[Pythium] brassicae (nom. inval.)]
MQQAQVAFVTWDAARGRRLCALAAFGARSAALEARLVCVDPPRADCATVKNAHELRGAVALVVRGGCSFALKARRVQAAGAVAMVLANNTREEPFAAFTMGEDGEDINSMQADAEPIAIPCVMMCLFDVRELFKQFPPTVKTGVMKIEVLDADSVDTQAILVECNLQHQTAVQSVERGRDANGTAGDSGSGAGGWGAIRRWKSTSLRKLLDPQTSAPVASQSQQEALATRDTDAHGRSFVRERGRPSNGFGGTSGEASGALGDGNSIDVGNRSSRGRPPGKSTKAPLFAFVQWSTSADSYEYHFAPLADFGLAGGNTIYEGDLVLCDPMRAEEATLKNAPELSNAIALVKRGSCTFPTKLERIQRCGAVAAIVGNDDDESPDAAFVMTVDHIEVDHVTIPSVMVSFNLFERLTKKNVKFVRILCLAGAAAANLMTSVGTPRLLADTPVQTAESGKEALLALHTACRSGDHGACQRILDENCAMDSERHEMVRAGDLNCLTALHHACVGGNEHVVSLLLSFDAAVDAVDFAMQTPLHVACIHRQDSCVRALIKTGVAQLAAGGLGILTTKQNIGGSTPLHYAAAAGSTECLEILLTANARVDDDGKYLFDGVSMPDRDGATPLHAACRNAHIDCVMYLIAANAELDAIDTNGHSALQICCEMANDPELESVTLRMIEKLVAAGARMSDPESSTGALLLDRIESATVKRELEVLYLRHEARTSQQDACATELEISRLRSQLTALQSEMKSMVAQKAAAEAAQEKLRQAFAAQQSQIEHLHTQMRTIIQILHSQNEGSPLPGAPAAFSLFAAGGAISASWLRDGRQSQGVTGATASYTPEAEESLSQEAALARDLGRKFAREQKFAVAEMYFEKSLDIFPLPGVHRLLEQMRRLRLEAEQRKADQQQQKQRRHQMLHPDSDTVSKAKLLQQLRTTLRQSQAPEQSQRSVEREISKLEMLREGTAEFEMARKWTEWLVALPWGDPFSGLQNADLFASRRDVFEQINLLEQEEHDQHRHRAVRRIQRAFREHFAVHMLHRSIALVRIQSAVRGYLARRRYCEMLVAVPKSVLSTGQHDGRELAPCQRHDSSDKSSERSLYVDYLSTLDPAASTKLRHAARASVITGVELVRHTPTSGQPTQSGELPAFRVLQLVRSSAVTKDHGAALPLSMTSSTSPREAPQAYYVWNRWDNAALATEGTLSGPYDQLTVAQQRYERVLREQLQKGSAVVPPGPALRETSRRSDVRHSTHQRKQGGSNNQAQSAQVQSWTRDRGPSTSLLKMSTFSA